MVSQSLSTKYSIKVYKPWHSAKHKMFCFPLWKLYLQKEHVLLSTNFYWCALLLNSLIKFIISWCVTNCLSPLLLKAKNLAIRSTFCTSLKGFIVSKSQVCPATASCSNWRGNKHTPNAKSVQWIFSNNNIFKLSFCSLRFISYFLFASFFIFFSSIYQ